MSTPLCISHFYLVLSCRKVFYTCCCSSCIPQIVIRCSASLYSKSYSGIRGIMTTKRSDSTLNHKTIGLHNNCTSLHNTARLIFDFNIIRHRKQVFDGGSSSTIRPKIGIRRCTSRRGSGNFSIVTITSGICFLEHKS